MQVDEKLFWRLPGPTSWSDQCIDLIRQSHLVIIEMPRVSLAVDPADHLESVFRSTGFEVQRVDLVDAHGELSLLDWVSEQVFDDVRILSDPGAEIPAFFGGLRLVVIDGRGASESAVGDVLRGVDRLRTRVKDVDSASFVVVAEGQLLDNPRDGRIPTLWWDRVLSELDIRVYVDVISRHFNERRPVMKSMLCFVKYELDLARYLLSNRWDGTSETAIQLMAKFAEQEREDTVPSVEEALSLSPEELWRLGLYFRSRENKGFFSPLIDHDSVAVDVWKWQLREFFPILEDRRQWILEIVRTDPAVMEKVNLELTRGDELDEPEIAELRRILEPVFPKGRRVLRWMNTARNKLAHRTALEPAFLEKGENLFETLQADFPHVRFVADLGPSSRAHIQSKV